MKNHGNQPKTMKNHETTLKNHGSDDFLLQTYRQTDTSPLYIYHHHHHHLQPSAEDSTSTLCAQQATGSHSRATRIGQRRLLATTAGASSAVRTHGAASLTWLWPDRKLDLASWSILKENLSSDWAKEITTTRCTHNQCTDVVAAPRTDSERPPNMKLVSTTVVNIVAEIRANISFKVMRLLQQWLVVSNAWPSSIRLIQGVSKNTEFYQIEHFQICHKYHKYFFPTGSRISKSSIW